MSFPAGRLRHSVAIQEKTQTRDLTTGGFTESWATVSGYEDVPAEILYQSVKEFMAANAQQSEITARITLRYEDLYNAKTIRILDNDTGKIFNPHGVLPDNKSGYEYVTIPVSEGVNQG